MWWDIYTIAWTSLHWELQSCVRGARVSAFKGALHELVDLQAAEGQLVHHTPSVTIISNFCFCFILSLHVPLTQLFFVYYYYLCYDINCRHTSNCVRVTLDFIYARVDWRSDCAYLAQVRLQYLVRSPSYSWHYYTRWTQEHVVGVLTQTKSPRTPK